MCLVLAFSSYSQDFYFTYQRNMTFKGADGKDYVVFESPDKSATDIASNVINNFMRIKTDEETIAGEDMHKEVRIYLMKRKMVRLKNVDWYADICFKMQFKEGRFRVLQPEISKFYKVDPMFGDFKGPDNVMLKLVISQNAVGQLEKRDVFVPRSSTYYELNNSVTTLINQLIAVPVQDEDDDDW